MRTTLTLDDDLAMALQENARATGRPFKTVVNEALRRGLGPAAQVRPPVTIAVHPLGNPTLDLTKATDLAMDLEVERYLRVTRELEEKSVDHDRP